MRIIGGEKRGFKILGPPEVKIKNLKPLPDRVREAIFNILGDWIKDKEVLDLYAGTGSFGLEALSREAKKAAFVELSSKTIQVIKKNLEKLGFKGSVFQSDAYEFIKKTKETYDLIYIGFPHKAVNFKTVQEAFKKLKKNGIIILESDSKTEISPFPNLKIFDQRIYGRLKISFLKALN